MTLTLWGRASSCNVQKAMWALEETGTTYRHVSLGGDAGGLDDPDYLAMNPNGRVPTLKDDTCVVWESDAIVRYIAAAYGAGSLWPVTASDRAAADQWMCWCAASLYRDWIDLFWKFVRTPPDKRDHDAIARHHARALRQYALLDRHLAGQPYLAGDTFTMADIPAGMTLYRWFEMDIERPPMPNLEAWYDRLSQRPAYQKGVCIPFDDLVGKIDY